MVKLVAGVVLFLAFFGETYSMAAQTPEPSPTATSTAPTDTPETAPPVVAIEPTRAEVRVTLTEDINGDGVKDDRDAIPAQTEAVLVPWADPSKTIELITSVEGDFAFTSLPAGDYTLRLFWPAGFASLGSSEAIPHLLRVVFRVNGDGSFAAPEPLPSTWPGLPEEKFDPATDGTIIGSPPTEVLLKRKNPDEVAVLPGAGESAFAFGLGEIDVARALRGDGGSSLLPSAGDGGARLQANNTTYWLFAALSVAGCIALFGWMVKQRRV